MTEVDRPGAERWVPPDADVAALRRAVPDCRGCELWRDATQAVFSTGSPEASVMLVGEQPGDREDREGEPFVGPAGRVLDDALAAAGIARADAYLTNAVKHFRFELRGKRRIHEKPAVGHLVACRPWLAAELRAVHPSVVVGLGATAARSLLGSPVRLGDLRGRVLPPPEGAPAPVVLTQHPSAVLRVRDADERGAAFDALVADLAIAAEAVKHPHSFAP
ncbi:UdgX family uracil-DNA binding protein [Agromyces sp. G08B096]|uniref:Type-4 uracil-DNA glycosylase n=1 Tax=Agromyces sp. G08B096 TaxID=3156399 RepID=A0AAU7W8C1_9MICO